MSEKPLRYDEGLEKLALAITCADSAMDYATIQGIVIEKSGNLKNTRKLLAVHVEEAITVPLGKGNTGMFSCCSRSSFRIKSSRGSFSMEDHEKGVNDLDGLLSGLSLQSVDKYLIFFFEMRETLNHHFIEMTQQNLIGIVEEWQRPYLVVWKDFENENSKNKQDHTRSQESFNTSPKNSTRFVATFINNLTRSKSKKSGSLNPELSLNIGCNEPISPPKVSNNHHIRRLSSRAQNPVDFVRNSDGNMRKNTELNSTDLSVFERNGFRSKVGDLNSRRNVSSPLLISKKSSIHPIDGVGMNRSRNSLDGMIDISKEASNKVIEKKVFESKSSAKLVNSGCGESSKPAIVPKLILPDSFLDLNKRTYN